MELFSDFDQVMNQKVIPLRKEKPNWIRLDGQIGVGNRKVFAFFKYKGKKWRIHSDTHFRMLYKAYKFIQAGKDPFLITKTAGDNHCLILVPELAERPKFIYIYLVK